MNPRLNGRNLMTIEFWASRRKIFSNSALGREIQHLSIRRGAKICKLRPMPTVCFMNKKYKTPFNIRWVLLNHRQQLLKRDRKIVKSQKKNTMKKKLKKSAIYSMKIKIQLRYRNNSSRRMMAIRNNVLS